MSEGNVRGSTTDRPSGASLPGQSRGSEQPRGSERERSGRSPGGGLDKASGGERGDLVTPNGRTKIADSVVAKVAGMAAREIGGVHDMGAGMSRTLGSVKERLPGGMGKQNATQGVAVQVGERQAAIDIDLIVEYGTSIPDLAAAVRDNVIDEVEHMCGLDVVEVNIEVADIHLPGEEAEEESQPSEPRVR
ncbi:Asp23/Gls24 family envelope stress response protein [Actinomadura sp. 9N407]|uniref:Asp23/Gls24 family envelope stress response protein n=1 Tax=Actinomadura sp. 9N407 TaxID=3375154 RepID=UPI003789F069